MITIPPRVYIDDMSTPSPSPRVVIVGGVAGGMSAATRLRRLMEHASITVIERSGHVSFANCGLPYHVGGVIEDRDALLLQTPESLGRRFGLDVRVRHEATAIDRRARLLHVRDLDSRIEFALPFDHLVLSPGARPFRPPIPGIERALSLRDIEDTDRMIDALEHAKNGNNSAVVVGGGFIGIELAENLRRRGLAVTLVEAADQIMTPLDIEMAAPVEQTLIDNGVEVRLSTTVSAIGPHSVTLDDGSQASADLVVAAMGVRPDVSLAVEAGLSIGASGGIVVDEQFRTNDPAIHAIGDAAEKIGVDGVEGLVPLAGPANRQGRLVADVIAGRDVRDPGVQGTAILGVFGLQAAITGRNERALRAAGIPIRVIHTHPLDHAGYYPGAEEMSLKLIVDPETDLILGAQGVGGAGIDKRIDVLATAMRAGLAARDLVDLDLTYAPQFGSAKDPVNMLGYIDANIADGDAATIQWHEVADQMLIDVRSPEEFARGSIPGAINIDLDNLRTRLDEVPAGSVVFCQVGLRGYLAARLLAQHGISVSNLDGGWRTWSAGHPRASLVGAAAT